MGVVTAIGGIVTMILFGCLSAFFMCHDKTAPPKTMDEVVKEREFMDRLYSAIQICCMPILAPLKIIEAHLQPLEPLDDRMRGYKPYVPSAEETARHEHVDGMLKIHGREYWKTLGKNKKDWRSGTPDVLASVQDELDAI